jgi:hypothetical protein
MILANGLLRRASRRIGSRALAAATTAAASTPPQSPVQKSFAGTWTMRCQAAAGSQPTIRRQRETGRSAGDDDLPKQPPLHTDRELAALRVGRAINATLMHHASIDHATGKSNIRDSNHNKVPAQSNVAQISNDERRIQRTGRPPLIFIYDETWFGCERDCPYRSFAILAWAVYFN